MKGLLQRSWAEQQLPFWRPLAGTTPNTLPNSNYRSRRPFLLLHDLEGATGPQKPHLMAGLKLYALPASQQRLRHPFQMDLVPICCPEHHFRGSYTGQGPCHPQENIA